MALVQAFHEVYGWCRIPATRQQLHADEWSVYDPARHNVDDVAAYLEQVGPNERARVIAAERSGKKRKTVLELADQPAAVPTDDDADLSQLPTPAGHTQQTPDASGAGDTTPTGDTPGTSTED